LDIAPHPLGEFTWQLNLYGHLMRQTTSEVEARFRRMALCMTAGTKRGADAFEAEANTVNARVRQTAPPVVMTVLLSDWVWWLAEHNRTGVLT